MGNLKRLRIKRDSLGRRTDRVKGWEARLIRKRAQEGYDATEIAREFRRDPRTVKAYLSLPVGAEPKENQGTEEPPPHHLDPELGPHGRELFYFGHRLRERLFVASPEQLLAPAVETGAVDLIDAVCKRSVAYPADMWLGRGFSSAAEGRPAGREEPGVEREWGPGFYNARVHSLYESFCQHLQGHPWLALMLVVERERSAYLDGAQERRVDKRGLRVMYESVMRSIEEFQGSLSPDARLRKLILEGRCELCLSPGRGIALDASGLAAQRSGG